MSRMEANHEAVKGPDIVLGRRSRWTTLRVDILAQSTSQMGEGTDPELFHAVDGAAHLLGDLVQGKLLKMVKNNHPPVVFGQGRQTIGNEDRPLPARRALAGRAAGRDKSRRDLRGVVQLLVQIDFPRDIAATGAVEAVQQVIELR